MSTPDALTDPDAPVIVVSAVTLRDETGRVLTVRKRGTRMFMQPGGKPEPGETPAQTALREVREELGLDLAPDALHETGFFRTVAANEPGHVLEAHVFAYRGACDLRRAAPAAEIDELRWLDVDAPCPDDVAPLLRRHILPRLREAGRSAADAQAGAAPA